MYIPVTFEAAALLAALTHPNHFEHLSDWGEFLCFLAATSMILGIGIQGIYDPSKKPVKIGQE
ncbi:MAG: hypothetical protein ACI96W_003793 [Paraglaciecola sp.]|jgi:hypothetical protein